LPPSVRKISLRQFAGKSDSELEVREMISRLAAYGIPVELAMFHNMEHAFSYRLRRPEQKRAAQVVAHFFQRRLK